MGFGPGAESQAHAPNEITWKQDLVTCAAVYAAVPGLYKEENKSADPALDGNAVGGEGPLVGQGTLPQAHGVQLGIGVLVADAPVAPQGMMGVNEGEDLPAVKKYGEDVKVSMYMYDRPAWTGLKYETESVETTNSGVMPSSLWMYCQHRPSQSSSCTVAVTRIRYPAGMRASSSAPSRRWRSWALTRRRSTRRATPWAGWGPVKKSLLSTDKNPVSHRDQAQVLHNLCAVHSGHHAALLVGAAPAIDDVPGLSKRFSKKFLVFQKFCLTSAFSML